MKKLIPEAKISRPKPKTPLPTRLSSRHLLGLEGMPRTTVVRDEGNYLHAEFRSRLLGFVDDVEFTYDAQAGVLHVRSASRLGRRDFGVNRARVEALRRRIGA